MLQNFGTVIENGTYRKIYDMNVELSIWQIKEFLNFC